MRKKLKSINTYDSLLSPFRKGWGLHLNKLEFLSPKDALCQVWLKLVQWFWRRRWKCEKFTTTTTTTTTRTTENGQIVIRKAHFSFWLRWVKNCLTVISSISRCKFIIYFMYLIFNLDGNAHFCTLDFHWWTVNDSDFIIKEPTT